MIAGHQEKGVGKSLVFTELSKLKAPYLANKKYQEFLQEIMAAVFALLKLLYYPRLVMLAWREL